MTAQTKIQEPVIEMEQEAISWRAPAGKYIVVVHGPVFDEAETLDEPPPAFDTLEEARRCRDEFNALDKRNPNTPALFGAFVYDDQGQTVD